MLGRKALFLGVVAWICILSSCRPEGGVTTGTSGTRQPPQKESPLLSKVGGEIITVEDFER